MLFINDLKRFDYYLKIRQNSDFHYYINTSIDPITQYPYIEVILYLPTLIHIPINYFQGFLP